MFIVTVVSVCCQIFNAGHREVDVFCFVRRVPPVAWGGGGEGRQQQQGEEEERRDKQVAAAAAAAEANK